MKRQGIKTKFWGLALVAMSLLASCSDNDIVADVTLPSELEQSQATGLESYSYTIPFEVKSDTEWKIEFDEAGEEIAYAHPAEGKGNATIKLYVLDNLDNESRQGNMTVVFPEDNSKNKVVTLKQKSQNGSDENFSADAVGNISYGVGYGFNVVTGVGARAIKSQIIKAQLLTEENLVQKAATSSSTIDFKSYAGSTVKELSNNFSTSFSLSVAKWGIEAEANAKFDVNNYSKEEFQYAMSFLDVNKEQITITLHEDDWMDWNDMDEGCYTKAAYKAINGINKKYASNNAGFKKLFDSYGTHVIRTATLGGRLTIATTINTTDISKEYNLEAFAKLSCSGILSVLDASSEVNEEYKNSYKENSNACHTKISALGGSSAIFSDLNDLVGEGAQNAAIAWLYSLNEDEENWNFIGLDGMDNLIPLWDLVEDADRAELMQEYFESGQYADDVTNGVEHDMGVQAYLAEKLPEFDVYGTQIADIKIGDDDIKTVARICNEFIPELDEVGPVKVVYPVINGKVKWNMGWFAGNSYYPPRRIVNVNGKIKVEEISSENEVGEAEEIYIRGIRIGSTPVDEVTEPERAKSVLYYERMMKENKLSDYKVVKILDNIWLAENFAARVTPTGDDIMMFHGTCPPKLNWEYRWENLDWYYKDWYYYDYSVAKNGYPEGWSTPDKDKMAAIVNMLKNYNINVVKAFGRGGCLRFHASPSGYYEMPKTSNGKNGFYTPDGFFLELDVEIGKDKSTTWVFYLNFASELYDANLEIGNYHNKHIYPYAMPVRLCKPIQ